MALSFTYRLDLSQAPPAERAALVTAVGAPIPALDQAFSGSIAGSSGWSLEPELSRVAPVPQLETGGSGGSPDPISASGLGFSCLDLLTAFSDGPP